MNCVIIIPIYRRLADESERMSLSSSFRHCKNNPSLKACIITHSEVNLTEVFSIAAENETTPVIKYFSKDFFKNIHGYNRLMLNYIFYQSFEIYDYMLICQLDAIILRDDILKWCDKGYDYIGVPLFAPGYENSAQYATVGNGGFSLRKISKFKAILGEKGALPIKELIKHHWPHHPKYSFNKKFLYTLMLFFCGRFSKILGFLSHWVPKDFFFSYALQNTSLEMKVPTIYEAALFAFDQQHQFWYYFNGNIIPLGVHQWNASNHPFLQCISNEINRRLR